MAKHKNTNPEDGGLFDDFGGNEVIEDKSPVTVLGLTFENDDERRSYFRSELRAKLPELRKIEGFPIGSDDDIINLSDPPYYTACPNPWLNDFIAEWEKEKKNMEVDGQRVSEFIVKEPYASDVSEGKNNPIYNAHGYHTKVPHTAIMKYILHYTQPGDIIFDAFSGSGMTGVASNMCADLNEVSSANKVGKRFCILSDLAPIASHIAAFYTLPFNYRKFYSEFSKVISEVNDEVGYLFETTVRNKKAKVTSTIWSDCFTCSHCGTNFALYDVAVDEDSQTITSNLTCPHCGSKGDKKDFDKEWISVWDPIINDVTTQWKKIPIKQFYNFNGERGSKRVSENEIDTLTSYIDSEYPEPYKLPDGEKTRAIDSTNRVQYLHQFYTPRTFTYLYHFSRKVKGNLFLESLLTAVAMSTSNQNKFRFSGTGIMTGTFFLPSISWEFSPSETMKRKANAFRNAQYSTRGNCVVNVASATSLSHMPDSSVDYIFIDPPFGANIMYSELSSIWEGWLGVSTNNKEEAIVNRVQKKSIFDYQRLMYQSFTEFYRILKPGKWMTVEFSNTSASVWNSIQIALQNVGFIVANVSALDKKQGSFNAVTTSTAVKQDLIISCFKPSEKMLEMFQSSTDSAQNIWDFINELLEHLPVHIVRDLKTTSVVERSPKILYDRLISYYVQRGLPVPIDARDFQAGLRERFLERDGMFFTADQAFDYENKKKATIGFEASQVLFVSSEAEGIEWLKRELQEPKTYADLTNPWNTAQLTPKKGDKIPELKTILEENFIEDEDGRWRVPDPEKEADLEKMRNRRLAHEFKAIVELALKPKSRIKDARLEALRYGFKEAYRTKDFETIVNVAQHLPEALVMEDEELLRYYDIASSRV